MNLNELEFKPGDFEPACGYHNEAADHAARIANRLLRERLGKAPKVHAKETMVPGAFNQWHSGRIFHARGRDTHRARLVCVEEIGN